MRCVEIVAAALLTAILNLQGCDTSEQTLRRLSGGPFKYEHQRPSTLVAGAKGIMTKNEGITPWPTDMSRQDAKPLEVQVLEQAKRAEAKAREEAMAAEKREAEERKTQQAEAQAAEEARVREQQRKEAEERARRQAKAQAAEEVRVRDDAKAREEAMAMAAERREAEETARREARIREEQQREGNEKAARIREKQQREAEKTTRRQANTQAAEEARIRENAKAREEAMAAEIRKAEERARRQAEAQAAEEARIRERTQLFIERVEKDKEAMLKARKDLKKEQLTQLTKTNVGNGNTFEGKTKRLSYDNAAGNQQKQQVQSYFADRVKKHEKAMREYWSKFAEEKKDETKDDVIRTERLQKVKEAMGKHTARPI